jgi:tetratricopeptide (TPR) repeat protein
LTRARGAPTFANETAMKPPAQPVSAPPPARRGLIALAALAIVLGILAAYRNSFSGALIFDDEPAILKNPTIRHLWPPWQAWLPPSDMTVTGRPLANFTLALNYALSGPHVWSYHALNVLIHSLAALTLFGVVRRTLLRDGRWKIEDGRWETVDRKRASGLRAPGSSLPPQDATLVAFAVAGIWALHPLQVEAVTYVIQRVESLMALFFLLVFYCFVRSIDSPHARRWQAGAVAACLLGAATKEVIAVAPVLLLFYDRAFVAGTFREAWRRRRGLYLALAATWVFLAAMVASAGWNRNGTSGFDVGVTPSSYWLTQFEAVVRYLALAVWPHPLVFEYGTFWGRLAAAWPYALVLIPPAVAALIALWRRPVLGFLGSWFFGILAPTSVMPGRIQMIVEHRMYLPLAAVIALVAGLVAGRCGRRGLVALLAAAVGLGWLASERNTVYRTAESLWRDTIAKRPDNWRAHNCLGVVLFDAGRIPEAIQSYETALRLRPGYPEAHNNLGYALTKAGRLPAAIEELGKALRLEPDYAIAHCNLGNALLQSGRVPEAIEHYETSLRIKSDDALTLYNLGNALLQAGRISEAIERYRASLRVEPESAETHYNLGNAFFQADRIPDAIEQYRAALRIEPNFTLAHSNLGNALLQVQRTPEAIGEFEAALRIDPNYTEGHNNLGAALSQAGRIKEAIAEFETALRLNPRYDDARRNLERMRSQEAAGGGKR